MKKIAIFLLVFIMLFLCIKSGLGFGKKESIIDKLNDKQKETTRIDKNNLDSYYTSTNPIDINYTIFNKNLSDSYLVLLNENSTFENNEFNKLKKTFDFKNNTYILLNTNAIKIFKINLIGDVNKDNITLNLNIEENKKINQSVIIEIKNVKINNISCIHIILNN